VPDATDNPFWNHFWVAKGAQMGREGVHVFTRPLRYRNKEITLPDGTIHAIKIIPQIGGAFLAGPQFFVEVAAKADKEEALKRSGLTYLLRLKAFHDERW